MRDRSLGEGMPKVNERTGNPSASAASSWSSSRGGRPGLPGAPSPTCARKGPTASTAASRSASEGASFSSAGVKKFTANGPDVSRLVSRMPSRTASGCRAPTAKEPSPPALVTAAARAGVEMPPAIGAWSTGHSMPSLRVKSFRFHMAGSFVQGRRRAASRIRTGGSSDCPLAGAAWIRRITSIPETTRPKAAKPWPSGLRRPP